MTCRPEQDPPDPVPPQLKMLIWIMLAVLFLVAAFDLWFS